MKAILAILAVVFLAGASQVALAQYDKLVVLETVGGDIVIELFPDDAPNHVKNFVELAESGFYDNTLFHRIIPGFMIQGGDPNTVAGDPDTWGTGGPETMLKAEFNTIKHNRGIVSMARAFDPDSAGSQFFIVHQNSNFLDQEYTVFGRIVTEESFEILDGMVNLATTSRDAPIEPEQARILKATVINRSDVSDLLQLGPPERTTDVADAMQNQSYEDPELGIVFSAPPGWLLQHIDKKDKAEPDIVAVGPKMGEANPIITLAIRDSAESTFDEIREERNRDIESAVSSGIIKIISQEESTVNGRDAFVTIATGSHHHGGESHDIKFKEVIIYNFEKTYALTYSNGVDYFDVQLPAFDESVVAFEISGPAESPLSESEDNMAGGGGCLIATSTYGSEMAQQVQMLREIRDGKIMNTASGSAFMAGFNQLYYSFSPAVADLERQNPAFKETIKLAITPMLSSLSLLNHVEISSEYDVLGWGTLVIMLNAGMYIVAPAVIVYRLIK